MYLSENNRYWTAFPFPVMEKIIIGPRFDLRDLLFRQQLAIPYYVLQLQEKSAHLYTGNLDQLTEVTTDFPIDLSDDYEYDPPSRSTSLAGDAHVKNFEKDKFSLEKKRTEAFFHQADELLNDYLKEEVLIICGTKRSCSSFLNRSRHGSNVISVIHGNYSAHELAGLAWSAIRSATFEKMLDALGIFEEKTGEGKAESGLVPVWEAVAEGRGRTLLVEKDLQLSAFLDAGFSDQLYLRQPKHPFIHLPDAVSALIESMLDKNGKVVFMENGMLQKYGGVALVTRY
jgi:hypothetical protein